MINKMAVKKLVEFRRFSEIKQRNFASELKVPKERREDDEGGGNYWVRSLSALGGAFRSGGNESIREKIEAVSPLYENSDDDRTRTMYKRNLEILHNYEEFDFISLRPEAEIKFLKKSQLPLTMKGIPLQVNPHHVYSFGPEGNPKLGSVWFVTWLKGFNPDDLGVFSEAQFRYLSAIFSDGNYVIDPFHCLTVDTLSMRNVRYSQILNGDIPSVLSGTIDRLNTYLS